MKENSVLYSAAEHLDSKMETKDVVLSNVSLFIFNNHLFSKTKRRNTGESLLREAIKFIIMCFPFSFMTFFLRHWH